MAPVNLRRSLSWTAARGDEAELLQTLQPNIIRPHVREHLSMMILRIDEVAAGRRFIYDVARQMKSTLQHLKEVEAFRAQGTPGTPYIGLGITASGYKRLGVPDERTPQDPKFRAGMKASRRSLNDPPVTAWEKPYQADIDVVLLIGDATDGALSAMRNTILDLFPDDGITLLIEETGSSLRNSRGDPIEHFGYVDGIDQPLYLSEDIQEERDRAIAPVVWDPEFKLDQVLVPEPAAQKEDVRYGSYLVFRKLEQNVRRFKQAERDIAARLGLTGEDRARAGAMLMGRFEDGTPLTLSSKAGGAGGIINNFTYEGDELGARCPLQSHMRKMNPRGSGGDAERLAKERERAMPRRGQTYGNRQDDPNADLPPQQRPAEGIGVLFMVFNSNIDSQFEYWVRGEDVDPPEAVAAKRVVPGPDPIIGQGKRLDVSIAPIWGANKQVNVGAVPQLITLKGGEYFFMPSLDFLNSFGEE